MGSSYRLVRSRSCQTTTDCCLLRPKKAQRKLWSLMGRSRRNSHDPSSTPSNSSARRLCWPLDKSYRHLRVYEWNANSLSSSSYSKSTCRQASPAHVRPNSLYALSISRLTRTFIFRSSWTVSRQGGQGISANSLKSNSRSALQAVGLTSNKILSSTNKASSNATSRESSLWWKTVCWPSARSLSAISVDTLRGSYPTVSLLNQPVKLSTTTLTGQSLIVRIPQPFNLSRVSCHYLRQT